MNEYQRPTRFSRGSGAIDPAAFARLGQGVVFEPTALVFHPQAIELGDLVYLGHQAILEGYHRNRMVLGDGCWIGAGAFLHSAGGLVVEADVGVGPRVVMLTSQHGPAPRELPIMAGALEFGPIHIGAGSDIGANATILPGVTLGRGVQVGAGAVVTRSVPDYAVVAGVPARVIGHR